MAAEGDQLPLFPACEKRFKGLVITQVYLGPVIKARPLQVFVVDLETKGVNQVKAKFRSPAQPGDVARVCRDLGLMQNHMEIRTRSDHENDLPNTLAV
jgi:hypothetical protein